MNTSHKPILSFASLWCISIGFLGIQFGWGLQMANMSAIYQMLGAKESQVAILWIAAPLTGLLVQPIIGHMSDRTWGRFGRRKPYFVVGAIISSAALIAMPNSTSLWMAVTLLWVLDGAINATMQPFRAFVADVLPEKQRAVGFSVQTVLIGIGAMVSSALIWMMAHWFGVSASAEAGIIPATIEYAFYFGAMVLLISVLITVFTTKEYPPEDMEAFRADIAKNTGIMGGLKELIAVTRAMPVRMKQLAWVQVFSWAAFFCMWTYFSPTITRTVFKAIAVSDPHYQEGIEWAGVCFSVYNGVSLLMAFALILMVKKYSPKMIHTVSLLCGGAGLLSLSLATTQTHLLFSMVGIGIAWASVLSMPYAMISSVIPQNRMGVYMGLFNIFIVIPQVVVALISGLVVEYFFGGNSSNMLVFGGICFIIAALLVKRVDCNTSQTEEPLMQNA